ncbi:MAG: hypothetical protein A2V66_13790 [Ignavibacteria bacterium RBG_13_36_8]|nr:MAG: hypothetical protein A2V66_13790 [Ignavibacteria bacterium RBG_13_36_8]
MFGGLVAACSGNYPPLEVVDKVDIEKYLGRWYEIARLPNSFEEGCFCVTAEYSVIDSTTIRVTNSCKEDSTLGELNQANGKAFVVEGSNNAKLRVQFFWPFRGDYWIIELDKENYLYALVGSPSREYLWILCRTSKMDQSIYNMLVEKAKAKGFDVSKLHLTNQECEE